MALLLRRFMQKHRSIDDATGFRCDFSLLAKYVKKPAFDFRLTCLREIIVCFIWFVKVH